MLKALKYTIYGLLLLLVLAVVGAIGFITLVDPNDYKEEIASKISARIGRPVHLNGKLNWSLYPVLGLKLHDITVDSGQGFKDRLGQFGEIDAGVKTSALLFSFKVKIQHILIKNGRVNLIVNKRGRANWLQTAVNNNTPPSNNNSANKKKPPKSSDKPRPDKHAPDKAQDTNYSDWLNNIPAISYFVIENTSVIYNNHQTGHKWQANDIKVTIRNFHFNHAFDVTTGLKLKRPDSPQARITLITRIDPELESNRVKFQPFKIASGIGEKSDHIKISGPIRLTNLDEFPKIIGQLKLKANPYSVANSLNFKSINPQFNKLHMTTNLEITSDYISLTELSGKIQNDPFDGQLDYSFNTPQLNFSLHFSALDPDALLALNSSSGKIHRHQRITSSDSINSAYFAQAAQKAHTTPRIDGEILVDKISTLNARNIKCSISTKSPGVYQLAPINMEVFNGHINGDALIQTSRNNWDIQSSTQLKSLQIDQILKYFKVKRWLTGSLSGQISADSESESLAKAVQKAHGHGHVQIRNGRLVNFDFYHKIRKALQIARLTNISSKLPDFKDKTPFKELDSKFRFDYPHIDNYDLLITGDHLRMDGSGNLNLANHQLRYKLLAQVNGQKIPVIVKGTFDKPHVSPDIDRLFKEYLDDVRKTPMHFKDQIKDVFKGFTQ